MTALTGVVRQSHLWLRLLVLVAVPVVLVLVLGQHAWAADDCAPNSDIPNLLCEPPQPDGSGKVLGIFDVVDNNGVPLSAYTLNVDQGGTLDVISKIIAFLIGVGFEFLKILIGFACWLVDWALDFGLAKVLLEPVSGIAATIYDKVIESLGLKILFLTLAALFAGYHILFKQRAKGWAEIGMSLFIASLATVSLANPGATLMGDGKHEDSGVLGTSKVFALGVADVVLEDRCAKEGSDPGETTTCSGQKKGDSAATAVSRPITDGLVDAFVTRPTFVMYTGLPVTDACSAAYSKSILVRYNWNRLVLPKMIEDKDNADFWDELGHTFSDVFSFDGVTDVLLISTMNPWAIATAVSSEQAEMLDELRDKAKETPAWQRYVTPTDKEFAKACDVESSEDADSPLDDQEISASLDNLISVWFIALAALITVILVVAVSATFLMSQVWMAIEVIRAQPAMIAGILPGGGRNMMWSWVSGVVRVILALALSIWFLTFFLVLIIAYLGAPGTGNTMTVKFVGIVILAGGFLVFRGKVTAAAKNVAQNFSQRMSRKTGGAIHEWDAPASALSNPTRDSKSGLEQLTGDRGTLSKMTGGARHLWKGKAPASGGGGGGTAGKPKKNFKQRVQGAVKLGAEVAVAAGTGGGSAAAKMAAKTALKQRLKNGAKNRLQKSRVGRGTLATARTGRYVVKDAPVTPGRFRNAVAAERRNIENAGQPANGGSRNTPQSGTRTSSQRTRDARRDASRQMRNTRSQARNDGQRLNRAVNGRRNQQQNQRRSSGRGSGLPRGNGGGGRGR
jgi:hypothetical protein